MFYLLAADSSNPNNFQPEILKTIDFNSDSNVIFSSEKEGIEFFTEVYSTIDKLESELKEVFKKLKEQRPKTRALRFLISSHPRIIDPECDRQCAKNRKFLISEYRKNRDWLESYKGEMDRLWSEWYKFDIYQI